MSMFEDSHKAKAEVERMQANYKDLIALFQHFSNYKIKFHCGRHNCPVELREMKDGKTFVTINFECRDGGETMPISVTHFILKRAQEMNSPAFSACMNSLMTWWVAENGGEFQFGKFFYKFQRKLQRVS